MKNVSMLVWLSQLGLSVIAPLAGFILLAVWLHNECGLGKWIIWLGIILGLISAVNGFLNSLKTMDMLAKDEKEREIPPSFNDHE